MNNENDKQDSVAYSENPKNDRVVTFEIDASKENKPASSQLAMIATKKH